MIATTQRFEVLPFGNVAGEAAELAEPVTLTVTCSPRHGLDHSVAFAADLVAAGHAVVIHIAARMVRGPGHLDEILARLAELGVDEVFLIGGDAPEPLGPYAAAGQLLPLLRAHPQAPRRIGVGAYPEGHPLIDDAALRDALREKAAVADYMSTQMCFDAATVVRWLRRLRRDGVELPLYVGVPGQVDRRRLLEISARIGVGTSIRAVRKQRGLRRLLGSPRDAATSLLDGLAAPIGEPQLGIVGVHYFTFNRLAATYAWSRERLIEPGAGDARAVAPVPSPETP